MEIEAPENARETRAKSAFQRNRAANRRNRMIRLAHKWQQCNRSFNKIPEFRLMFSRSQSDREAGCNSSELNSRPFGDSSDRAFLEVPNLGSLKKLKLLSYRKS